jgi:hypothetical protein
MKVLAALLLSFTLPPLHTAPVPRAPVDPQHAQKAHHRGTWYFAENGHAVYCYGPVMVVSSATGEVQRVATFCRDGQTMVPLKD